MAQTCGAHQGAEVTSAWFEASGDLQSANEERGEMRDEDEDKGRGEGWGWSEDEGELVALSSRAAVALDARAVCARGLALWVTRSDSELNAQTTLTISQTKHLWVAECKRSIQGHDKAQF